MTLSFKEKNHMYTYILSVSLRKGMKVFGNNQLSNQISIQNRLECKNPIQDTFSDIFISIYCSWAWILAHSIWY